MSAETKATLEAALEAHVADECDGDMVGAWVALAETTTLDDMDAEASVFYIEARNQQSSFLTSGLLHAAIERSTWRDVDE